MNTLVWKHRNFVIFLIQIIVKFAGKEGNVYSQTSAVAHEALSAIRTVTAFGGQKKEEAR